MNGFNAVFSTHEEPDSPPLSRHVVAVPDVIFDENTLQRPRENEGQVDEEVENSTTSAKHKMSILFYVNLSEMK